MPTSPPGSSSAGGPQNMAAAVRRHARNGRTAVLVIEQPAAARALCRCNGFLGLPLDLVYCDNGYKALLEIARSKPDVVLADIVMEGMDGYEW
jgi:CheY-like chemotaxis protein